MRAALDGDRALVERLPSQIEPIALYHRHRLVIGRMHPYQTCFAESRNDSVAADGEDSGADTKAVDQQMCRGLGRGDNIRRSRRNAQLDQMVGDRSRRACGVVGDETDLGPTIMELRNTRCGAEYRDRTQIDDAIEIEQHRVVGVDDRRWCTHGRTSRPGSCDDWLSSSSPSS